MRPNRVKNLLCENMMIDCMHDLLIKCWEQEVKYTKNYCQSIKNFDILLIEAMIKREHSNQN